jgi:hypothetical protein
MTNLHKILEILVNDLDQQLNTLEDRANEMDDKEKEIALKAIKDIKEAIGNEDIEKINNLKDTLPKIFS